MKNDFFENIGNRLNQYDSPVDLDAEWNAVSNRQKEEKKRRAILWVSVVLAALISVGGYFSFGSFGEETPELPEQKFAADEKSPSADLKKETFEITRKKQSVETSKPSVISKKEEITSNIQLAQKQFDETEKTSNPINLVENNLAIFQKNDLKIASSHSETTIEKTAILALPATLEANKLNLLSQKTDKLDLPEISPTSINAEKSAQRKIQLFFNGGLAMTGQNFKAKNTADDAYAQLRSDSEMTLETYSYEAGVNYFFNKKSFIRAAADYNIGFDQINHQYDLPKDFDFENVLLRRLIYPSGDVEEIYGDTTILGSQTLMTTQFNKYTFVNFSLSFGHLILEKSKFSIAVTGGLSQNISLKSKGNIIDDGNPNAPLTAIDGYKKTYGLGVLGGLDFDYQLTNRTKLNIRPSGAYSLSSAMKKENILDSNFYRIGISAGLKFNL